MSAFEVTFRLLFGTRKDDEAGVFVGYCPVLDLYSQGTTQNEAENAVVDAAKLYISTCYKRDSLHRILRGRGFVDAVPGVVAESSEEQYITVKDLQDYDYEHQFYKDVPIELLGVRQEAAATCP